MTASDYARMTAASVLDALCPGGTPADGVEVDQDWSTGTTTIAFRDGSRLTVSGESVEVAGPREYVWLPSPSWGGDHVVSDEEHAAACERAEEWLTEHEGDALSIMVRPARHGEALGTYERGSRGDLQILGFSVDVPGDVESLIARAWDHAVSTWPAEVGE